MSKEKQKKNRNYWYCYVCGKKIGFEEEVNVGFVLVAPTERTDRAFLVHFSKECINQIDRTDQTFVQARQNKIYTF